MEQNLLHVPLCNLQFKHPFTMIVAGPTGSGKTMIVRHILESWKILININVKNLKVLWYHGQHQELHNEDIKNIETIYINGKPHDKDIETFKPNIIVVDDLMDELRNDDTLAKIFTRGSHHNNICIIYIIQNLFLKGQQMRTISLNSQYFILTKNRRDLKQIETFGRQCFPGKSKGFLKVYEKATDKPFGYLLFDSHVSTEESQRLRTRITPQEINTKNSIQPICFELL
jgi:hypothetical protein